MWQYNSRSQVEGFTNNQDLCSMFECAAGSGVSINYGQNGVLSPAAGYAAGSTAAA